MSLYRTNVLDSRNKTFHCFYYFHGLLSLHKSVDFTPMLMSHPLSHVISRYGAKGLENNKVCLKLENVQFCIIIANMHKEQS